MKEEKKEKKTDYQKFLEEQGKELELRNKVLRPGSIDPRHLSGKIDENVKPKWSNIQNKPSAYPPSSHNHDDRYFQKSEHIDQSVGVPDAGKPIKLAADGKIDNSMLPTLGGELNISGYFDYDLKMFLMNPQVLGGNYDADLKALSISPRLSI